MGGICHQNPRTSHLLRQDLVRHVTRVSTSQCCPIAPSVFGHTRKDILIYSPLAMNLLKHFGSMIPASYPCTTWTGAFIWRIRLRYQTPAPSQSSLCLQSMKFLRLSDNVYPQSWFACIILDVRIGAYRNGGRAMEDYPSQIGRF